MTKKKQATSKFFAVFMAVIMAFTMMLPAGSLAWAEGEGTTEPTPPEVGTDVTSVNVISIVNTFGMPDTPGHPGQYLTSDGTYKANIISSTRSLTAPKSTDDENANFTVLVNPKAPNMTTGRPTQTGIVITVGTDENIIGYSMNVTPGQPLKEMQITGNDENAQFMPTGNTVPATDFKYDPTTGVMTIDKKYQDAVITIYNYLGSNQLGDKPTIYANEKLNGNDVALNTQTPVTSTVDGDSSTYYLQPATGLNAIFSEMPHNGGDAGYLAYRVESVHAYAATIKDNKVLGQWELKRGQDYTVDAQGNFSLKNDVNVLYVLVKSDIVTKTSQVTPYLISKTGESLTFMKADGYSYKLTKKDGTLISDWSKNPTYTGLEEGTKYTIYYRNDATGAISQKNVTTNDNNPKNFTMPVQKGDTFTCQVYPWNWSEIGHTSFGVTLTNWGGSNEDGVKMLNEKTNGIQYWFYCISPGLPNTAKYYYGKPMNANVTCTGADPTTGLASFRLQTDGAYYPAWGHPVVNGRPVQQMAGNFDVTADMPIQIDLKKASMFGDISDDNSNYSLYGTEYGVFADEGCTSLVDTISIDDSGYGISDDLKAGTYYVKETKVPEGGNYALSSTVYTVEGAQGGMTYTVQGEGDNNEVIEIPMSKTWQFYKIDKQSGLSAGQGGATVKGAEFAVNYYNVKSVDDIGGMTPTRSWTLASDENGMVTLDPEHKVSGDELFQSVDGTYVFPCGVYSIQETKAPEGYLKTDTTVHYVTMQTSYDEQMAGEPIVKHTADNVKVADQVKRGDFKLIKINKDTQEPMPNVAFIVSSDDTGEAHVVVTDKNGFIRTDAAYNPHTDNTNANDKAVDKNGDGKFSAEEIANVDESKLDYLAGTYFFGYAPDHEGYNKVGVSDEQYGLPYGDYTITELRTSATEGMQLVERHLTIERNTVLVEVGTISDGVITIGTTATDQATGDHEGDPQQETVTILDDVDYANLTPGKKYTLKAELHIKNIDDNGKITDGGVLMVNGKAVTAEESFTPDSPNGTYTMKFTVPGSALQTKSVVAFENLYDENGVFVIAHAKIDDEGQTVNYPGIHTTATDSATGDHEGNAVDEETTINDVVKYDGLTPGKKYTMNGKLMNRETGKPLVDDEGHEFTASVEFVPESASGEVTLTYTLPTRYVAGKTVVVFEDCVNERGPVASHADINDEEQTVYYPALRTTATDSVTKDHEGLANETITINDLVEYENLIKGETYTISGKIMDKATGEALKGADGKEFTAFTTFVAGVDDKVAEANELVSVYLEVAGKVLDIYKNMSDDEKAAYLEKIDGTELPEFPTIAELKALVDEACTDGSDVLKEDKEMLENLDKFYLSLTDEQKKETTELVSVEKLFGAVDTLADASKDAADKDDEAEETGKPERVSGSVIVSFQIPGDIVRGKTTVVFEDLYFGDTTNDENKKAKHEDINDEGQTVVYPEIHTTATIGGEKVAPARDIIVITDTITYTNLTPGKEYTFKGVLMDKETNETVKNEDGSEVRAETTFTPETPDGTVDVEFSFNAMAIQFHDVVVFEEGWRDSDVADELILVAEHKDINDADQTVRIDDAGLADELIETGELPQAGDIVVYVLVSVAFLAGCYAIAYRHRKRNLID